MTSTKASPQTWTLRLKNNRTTILLHVDPLQKLSSVKSEILRAVKETHPNGLLNGKSIPTAADDILLAKPVDINDLEAGWESLENQDFESGKGKGKAAATGSSSNRDGAKNATPKSVGLRDGGVVAFKFRTNNDDVEDDDLGEWDVVVPSLEELYGDGLPMEDGSEGGG